MDQAYPLRKLDTLILASASERRVDLLAQMGVQPGQIVPADVDETPLKKELPSHYVTRVTRDKAAAIAKIHPNQFILAGDTAVICGRRIIGKASDAAEAKEHIQQLSGRRHRVYTAIVLYNPTTKKYSTRTVCTTVKFKRLTSQEIEDYINIGEWKGKSGSYSIQGYAARYIEWMQGSFSSVVGLPIHETYQLFTGAGLL